MRVLSSPLPALTWALLLSLLPALAYTDRGGRHPVDHYGSDGPGHRSSLHPALDTTALDPPLDTALGAKFRSLPTLREQDALERGWVQKRWDHVPKVLKKHGFDAWILSMREYAEDTAFRALVSTTTTFSARRRTLFLFHTHPEIESPLYLVDNTPEMWVKLNKTLFDVDPARIAIDIDSGVAFADGLHTGEGMALLSNLDPKYLNRTEPSRAIPIEVVAARVGGDEQLAEYKLMMENVWAMVAEGFSERVITVGKTTPEDLEWWFRDVMRWRIGTGTWFPPSVDISRHPDEPSMDRDPFFRPGDMIHVDIGITAMGMNTDTQHLGYILRSNETAPPTGLIKGLHDANKLQDFVRGEMIPGRTGDQVFFAVKDRMDAAGLDGDIYSHPIGDYGHSAGAIIGMTNIQGAVPELGSNHVLENYWTSVELGGRTYVPEWGRTVRFELEEDVYWNGTSETFEWVWGQQTSFHLVRPRDSSANVNDEGTGPAGVVGWVSAKLGWKVMRWL